MYVAGTRRDGLALLFFLLLACLFLIRPLFFGWWLWAPDIINSFSPWKEEMEGATSPHNPLLSDQTFQFLPWQRFTIEALKEGRLPLWNPHSYTGVPHLANLQSAPLNPLNLLFLFFPMQKALALSALVRMSLAGFFMYLFLKDLGLSPLARCIGGVSLEFCGFFSCWLGHPMMQVGWWLSIIFFLGQRLAKKPSFKLSALLAVVLAFQVLSGHLATSLHILLALTLYFAFLSGLEKRAWGLYALALSLGLLTAMPQLLPFLEYLRHSEAMAFRSHEPIGGAHLPWEYILTLLSPDAFGNPQAHIYFGRANYNEGASYIGIAGLFLALLALLKPRRETSFFVLMAFFSLATALGLPPLPFILAHLPLFSRINNIRLLLIACFSLATLAGIGVEAFTEVRQRQGPKNFLMGLALSLGFLSMSLAVFLFFILPSIASPKAMFVLSRALFRLGLFALAFSLLGIVAFKRPNLSGRFLKGGLLTLLVLDLFCAFISYNSTPYRDKPFPLTRSLTFLKAHTGLERFLAIDDILPPNSAMADGLYDVNGYDSMEIRETFEFLRQSGFKDYFLRTSETPAHGHKGPLIDLLGAKYILSKGPLEGYPLLFDGKGMKVFLNPGAFPRCFLAKSWKRAQSHQQALELLKTFAEEGKSLQETAIVEGLEDGTGGGGTALIASYKPEVVRVKAWVEEGGGLLVLTDAFFPGWRAEVDGQKVPLLRAYSAFRGVWLSEGEHWVTFTYRPESLFIGLAMGIVGLLSIGMCLLSRGNLFRGQGSGIRGQ